MKKFLLIVLLVPLLLVTLWGLDQKFDLRKSAFGKKADIVVDLAQPGGRISASLWRNFAQGGEEPVDMIAPVLGLTKDLQPEVIRIDHIFDFYVTINGDQYDFSKLDGVVRTILSTGAVPMLALSYMPSALAEDGQVISPPKDWSAWQRLVAATVARYSGKNGLNLYNIYYEVWNEPDLFGGWHYGKTPNYLTLYRYSVLGAKSVTNVNPFKLGGPATTGFYPNWLKALFKFADANKLPVDFVSWHRYTSDLDEYQQDFEKLNRILTDYPDYQNVERMITEFGPDSENSPWYDNQIGAAHTIAGMIKLLGKVHRVFTFEIKDGPDPAGKQYWGRWGLVTHEKQGVVTKPRYRAIQFLNQLSGNRLSLDGEGSWVSAVASQDQKTTKVLLVNYDSRNSNYESVPVTLNNASPGLYLFKLSYLDGKSSSSRENLVGQTQIKKEIILPPNSAALAEWRKMN
ncbi:MAG: glycosyl hydrolase [Patescibacteria group bacterium]